MIAFRIPNPRIRKDSQKKLHLPNQKKHTFNLALWVSNRPDKPTQVSLALNAYANHMVLQVSEIAVQQNEWPSRSRKKFAPEPGNRALVGGIENTQNYGFSLIASRPLMNDASLQGPRASRCLALKAVKVASRVYEFLGRRRIASEGGSEKIHHRSLKWDACWNIGIQCSILLIRS